MCGICGLVHADRDGRVEPTTLARMNEALIHRGPDEAGQWDVGPAGLAMRRLSVIDLFRGQQPMVSDDGTIAVVFNGEIYNYRRLRHRLEVKGATLHTQSDTEVILRAYEMFGDEAVQQLNGMFAFAIYDTRRHRLVIMRDRLGIKPLFYTARNGVLAFASELGSLYASGLVDGRLNAAALDAYFNFLYIPAPDTVFANAHKLGPGEKLVFENGHPRVERYWDVSFETDSSWTMDSAAERYRELLQQAVAMQRVSDVPLGAFLSGGLDSSSVVGALVQANRGPVRTYTVGFDDKHVDELKYARVAAEHFGTDHTETILKPDLIELMPKLTTHFGEPFGDSSALPTWLVSQVAREGVTVALSGDGGDELFAGYTWAHMARRVNQYRGVPAPLRGLVDVALRGAPRSPKMEKLRRFSKDSFLTPMDGFRRRETCFTDAMRAVLYGPVLQERVLEAAVDRFDEHAFRNAALSDDDRMLHQDLVMYLPDDILTKVDRMSMAHGLEARVPILDHRIVEFAATVPFDLKYHRGQSKALVKHALADMLPPALRAQRKQGFAIPIQRWFRETLADRFQDVVLAPDSRCRGWLRMPTIRHLYDTHQAGKEDYGHHLWAVLMFEDWLRYIDGAPGLRVT
jgi:asparagine synthase (glutamine-hydrolysing)